MNKRNSLISLTVAGLIAAGGVVKASSAFAHDEPGAEANKDGCKGKKDGCGGKKDSCKGKGHGKKHGKKDSCKGKKEGEEKAAE